MCEPARLISLYKAVVEQGLGVTAHVAENNRALIFTCDDVTYVLRNTAPSKPGLLDVAVYLPSDESRGLKEQACRQVALSVPCLRAWVDADDDIVVNFQSLTGPIGLMPPLGLIKELLPEALQILRYAVIQVSEDVVLAGIVSASQDSDNTTRD